ncbi:MAG: hypothetical protein J5923_06425 [Acidaminococcaceae bacterium]|nr:hypothetical protein [Acidaminococcaceae bacterium]
MAKQEESIFKKGYTEFDERLDSELEEEKDERRKQLLLQAPDYKLLNWMAEHGESPEELGVKLRDAGYYFLRSGAEEETEKIMTVLHKVVEGQPSLRGDILKQAGFFGCLAFKRNMPVLGRACAELILKDLRLIGADERDLVEEGYLLLKNVADTAAHTRNDEVFKKIVEAFCSHWKRGYAVITNGLTALLADLLFVAADRRYMVALKQICRLNRNVLRHESVDPVMRQQFVLEWSRVAAQIAQRGWDAECTVLLKEMCLLLGSVKDFGLIKKVIADVAVHMQMQSQWDSFENACRVYYPYCLFHLAVLQWTLRRYDCLTHQEGILSLDTGAQESGMADRLEQKMNLLSEKETVVDMIRFLLRNGRDFTAACARLLMKDEWEIYLSWFHEGMAIAGKHEKTRRRIRKYLQMVAEYWRCTQPSRSKKQWERIAEIMRPSEMSEEESALVDRLA